MQLEKEDVMKVTVAKFVERTSTRTAVNRFNPRSAPSLSRATTEDNIAALFGPDSLLPAQLFQTMRRKASLEPETKLMLAILKDAIDCFQNNLRRGHVKSRRLFNEAAAWILDVNSAWVFSFDSICEHLALDPAYVRQGLMQWMEKELANQPAGRARARERFGKKQKYIACGAV
jgi:hypothetical protein